MTATAKQVEQSHHYIEGRVVAAMRELAREIGGDRAANAVTPTASLERDVGLGSLERVELLTRLEADLGRQLDDRFLTLDSAREIATAAMEAPPLREGHAMLVEREPPPAPIDVAHIETLVEGLARRAAAEPNRVHVHLYGDAGIEPVTYAELWDGAARIARALEARGLKRGDTVSIILPTGLDYLHAFMGVLAAGGIAVPLYPPVRLDRLVDYIQRQSRILANANSRFMIVMEEALPVARMLHRAAPVLETIVTTRQLRTEADPITEWTGEGSDGALIQYTSGSTGDPKGVLLTNDNLLANIRAIASGAHIEPTDAVVSWLPLYHDMGLIGAWLNTMVQGIPLVLMSPLSFLARPERWLWAIHEHRATLSPAPNFAFELCVRKIRDEALEGLDLSSWRIASNGAEPVSPATLDRFVRRFEPYGFKREALLPVYGLAESSVALAFAPLGRGPVVDQVDRTAFEHGLATPATTTAAAPLSFVSVGTPLPDHEIRVTNEQGELVGDRVVGKLSFRGPSCTSGYYRNPEATARVISADGWIDSGDLAYRADGELYITGRIKDLIIKGGRNIVPQEVEEVVGAVEGIRKGCVAAFGLADEASGTERMVVLAESRSTDKSSWQSLERDVIAAVVTGVGIPPDAVRIVPPGSVPKTPSGKIRRTAARELYQSGDVEAHAGVPLALRLRLGAGVAASKLRAGASATLRGIQILYLVIALTVTLVVLGIPIAILLYTLPEGRPVRALARFIARVLLRVGGCRIEVDGADRVPKTGALVFVANHTSYADTPVLLASLPTDFAFVAMAEILTWKVVGTLVRRGNHLTVDRWKMRQSVADAGAVSARLRDGDTILVFPEGGFARARGVRPFRLGAFEAAAQTGAKIIPVALRGSRELLPADSALPRPRKIQVWIGEPIEAGGSDWKSVIALRDRAADAVAAHCGEPRLHGPQPSTREPSVE